MLLYLSSAEMIEDTECDLLRGILFPGVREEICFSFDFSPIFFSVFSSLDHEGGKKDKMQRNTMEQTLLIL